MAAQPWGGSEELWSRTALRLHDLGEPVSASVVAWPEISRNVHAMRCRRIPIHFRRATPSLWRRAARGLLGSQRDPWSLPVEDFRWLVRQRPKLVLISQGGPWDGLPWMLACHAAKLPYQAIVQANSETWWPDDAWLELARTAYTSAERVYFVSSANHQLLEDQCGTPLPQAEIVCNPWNDQHAGYAAWPSTQRGYELACVGRLDPRAKGQDLAIRLLATAPWRERPLRVTFHGNGPCAASLQALGNRLCPKTTTFAGHIDCPTRIWQRHHALLLPSRHEGLPLVIVEAMRHARMVITTAVADNARYLTDNVTGFIAPAAAAAPLAETLERAWNARHRWREMGLHARETVLSQLPPDPVETFAHRLLACTPPPSS